MKRRAAVWAAVLLATHVASVSAASGPLPIYIEDNHAGSFYWLAQHLDLDEPCTLLHFDAHSDASAIFDSDKIRAALRQVTSPAERQQLLDKWRGQGAVQCFGWIEPLMPAPIANVLWVPADTLDDARKTQSTATAVAQIDGHLEAAPREAGSFRDRYQVVSLDHLEAGLSSAQPLVVTIDLDYFAGRPAEVQAVEFERVWNLVARQPDLRAITFAISRSYLQSAEEADRLLLLALRAAFSLPTARLQFEPFLAVENDRSIRATELRAAGRTPPRYSIATASLELRAAILAHRDRIQVTHDRDEWENTLRQWGNAGRIHLEVKDAQQSTDGVWRIQATEATTINLVADPWTSKVGCVEWFALLPKNYVCNVTDLDAQQVGFVSGAAPRPAWREQRIASSDTVLPTACLDPFFARPAGCGSLRLYARAVVDSVLVETRAMEIRRYAGAGLRAAITEQFGLPYLFGSGQMSNGIDTGPEMDLGADCANFIVYALRRQGWRVPWSDPKELRAHLQLIASSAATGSTRITNEELERGLIVHLGSHVAAVMEDRAPMGVLDENDLVAHQLKGAPEMLTLGELLRQRKRDKFDLLTVPPTQDGPTILFGGDIMLGRSCASKIMQGIDPFAGIRDLLARSVFAAANLECTISSHEERPSGKKCLFLAPAQSAFLLRDAGFRAVSLANNHALDFGEDALKRCAQSLTNERIQPVGAGMTEDAYTPGIFALGQGKKLALLAVSDLPAVSEDRASREPTHLEIAQTSDRARLRTAIKLARTKADAVACMVHWGTENTNIVTDRQRELARWLIDQGVDVVVGAHPHCLQPLDFYHGRPIAYSLGNLVFDGAPTVASWNHGAFLQIQLTPDARVRSSCLIPITLQDGLPQSQPVTPGAIAEK